MAYRVHPDGSVGTDTLKEALALQRLILAPTKPARIFRLVFDSAGPPPEELLAEMRRRGLSYRVFEVKEFLRPIAGNWWRFTSE